MISPYYNINILLATPSQGLPCVPRAAWRCQNQTKMLRRKVMASPCKYIPPESLALRSIIRNKELE